MNNQINEYVEISTNEELKEDMNKRMPKIALSGEIAEKVFEQRKKAKRKRITGGIVTGTLAVGAVVAGICLSPFTAGASAAAGGAFAAHALTITTAAGTTIAVSAAEIAILSGFVASALGCSVLIAKDLIKNYNIEIEKDGSKVYLSLKDKKQKTRKISANNQDE